ncbi:hypothetical protein [Burkholderia gladioli]|uniref:hypothetical protein n=1 Tax=Burkholderia gladioli TaxID=28095 RepID=UPI00163FE123|nr:hypothetical protein [Burkholderia gladioli]
MSKEIRWPISRWKAGALISSGYLIEFAPLAERRETPGLNRIDRTGIVRQLSEVSDCLAATQTGYC